MEVIGQDMKNKICLAKYLASEAYAELISSALKAEDILPVMPEVGNDIELQIKETPQNEFDAIVLDLSALKDTDDQILKVLETIRFWDDNIRIILLAANRYPGDRLLKECFLAGIYNITCSNDYVEIRDFLHKALTIGMTYKEAMEFKKEASRPRKMVQRKENIKVHIALCGTQNRIGVTHNTLTLAYTLRKMGYIVAVRERKESQDFFSIMESYQAEKQDGYYSLEDVDFYPYQNKDSFGDRAYNFILSDMGTISSYLLEQEKIDDVLLVCGSKAWELGYLTSAISQNISQKENVNYLFNFTDDSMKKDLMQEFGRPVYFAEYHADPFVSSLKEYVKKFEPEKEKRKGFLNFKKISKDSPNSTGGGRNRQKQA